MNHVSVEQWRLYVDDQLAEKTRRQYEEHLATCDQCFEVYLQTITEADEHIVEIPRDFTEEIVRYVDNEVGFTHSKNSSSKKKSLIHYSIAAGLTIVFMFSGLFTEIMAVPDYVKSRIVTENKETFTEKILQKRIELITNMKQKEGDQ